MEFIGYCNGELSKKECAAFFRNRATTLQIPVHRNGAVITGKTIDGVQIYRDCLTVIDFDVKKGEKLYAAQLPHICKQTMLVQTGGGGIHAYFYITDSIVGNQAHKKVKLPMLKQIDIRGEGGIIFAAGCRFTDHKQPYTSINSNQPLEITTAQFNTIMSELISPKVEATEKPISDTFKIRQGFKDIISGLYKVPHLKDSITDVDEFKIWNAFYREIHNSGIDFNTVWNGWNRDKSLQPEFNQVTAEYQINKISPKIYAKSPSTKLYESIFPQYKKVKEIKETKIAWDIQFANYWDEHFAKTMVWIDDWQKWVVYNGKGTYKKVSELEFTRILIEWLDANTIKFTSRKIHVAKNRITSNNYITLDSFDMDKNIRNVKNGLLHLDTRELTPHTPDYLSFNQANANYLEPKQLLPTICWDAMQVKYPHNIKKVEWFLKNIIYNDMSNEKALFIVGINRSGKGSTLGMISEIFPHTITAHQGIETLGTPFGISPLVGKNLNIDSEGIITKLNAFSVKFFKLIVGRDGYITVNPKGTPQFEHNFELLFFISAMNQLYRLPGTDLSAWFSRVVIAEFNKRENKPDPLFKDRLKGEVDSIFSKLVHEGHESFNSFYEKITGTEYDLEKYCIDTQKIWDSWSNPITMICNGLFKKGVEGDVIDTSTAQEYVEDGLVDAGFIIPAPNHFAAQVKSALKKLGIKKHQSGSNYHYAPIKLIDPEMEKQQKLNMYDS